MSKSAPHGVSHALRHQPESPHVQQSSPPPDEPGVQLFFPDVHPDKEEVLAAPVPKQVADGAVRGHQRLGREDGLKLLQGGKGSSCKGKKIAQTVNCRKQICAALLYRNLSAAVSLLDRVS